MPRISTQVSSPIDRLSTYRINSGDGFVSFLNQSRRRLIPGLTNGHLQVRHSEVAYLAHISPSMGSVPPHYADSSPVVADHCGMRQRELTFDTKSILPTSVISQSPGCLAPISVHRTLEVRI